jgi:hypothetical protein
MPGGCVTPAPTIPAYKSYLEQNLERGIYSNVRNVDWNLEQLKSLADKVLDTSD